MKLQAPAVTAFFPAALAAGSISLAVLLLPVGTAPARSPDLAPALKLVAGDVVAAVKVPVHAVVRSVHARPVVSHPKPAAVGRTRTQPRSASAPKQTVPTHRRPSPARVSPTRVVAHASPTAAAPVVPVVVRSRGRANARGHLAKLVHHGPRATPPGQAKKASRADEHAAHAHGGGT